MRKPHVTNTGRPSRFALWRVVVWIVLLLAAFGVLQYCMHAWSMIMHLQQRVPAAVQGHLQHDLVWDVVYLLVACITLCLAGGTLLRRGWARPLLRVVTGLLAVWFLVTAGIWISHWSDFNQHTASLMAQPSMGEAGRALVARVHRNYAVGLALKLVAVPVLAWLAWRLGSATVRTQFLPRRQGASD